MSASAPLSLTAGSLANLDRTEWRVRIQDEAERLGHFEPLGNNHFAALVEPDHVYTRNQSRTLLVTFETVQNMRSLTEDAHPIGWHHVDKDGWSHLLLASSGETWFREPRLYGYMDRLVDDGFFDDFDRVLFYGAGTCGYAAAAFSVAAPGARVLAIQPQATLDPRVTEWDDRFTEMRRTSFTDRYGYAPDMLDAAQQAYVLYDPAQNLDAMHAALFTRINVTKFRLRHMGGALQTSLLAMNLLHDLIRLAEAGNLDTPSFARAYRQRRDFPPYLRQLLNVLEAAGREKLVQALCRNVTARMRMPRFRKRLRRVQDQDLDESV